VSTAETIRTTLTQHGKLAVDVATLGDDDSLFSAGLTSHATVNVMLALEDAFDVEFPDSLLKRATFVSISSLRDAVDSLLDTDG
jgi:acyl carrier protein